MQTAPDRVTRFYGDPSFALDALDKQKVALVRATRLNDPFDPYGFFRPISGGTQSYHGTCKRIIRQIGDGSGYV
jgi:hypothetical protein